MLVKEQRTMRCELSAGAALYSVAVVNTEGRILRKMLWEAHQQ